MKSVLAFLLGAVGLIVIATIVWLYLSMETIKEGGDLPTFVADRIGAMLFALALGTALSASGYTYYYERAKSSNPLNEWYFYILPILIPFFVCFCVLFIAHSQFPSMQYTNKGEYLSPWGYLIICPLPVIIGMYLGYKLENWFSEK